MKSMKGYRPSVSERSGFSAREIRRVKFRGDGICVNQERTNVRAVLHSGDVLAVCLDETEEQPEKILPWPGPLEVLYLDEDLIAVNKPSGMAIHPSHGHYADTLLNRVTAYLMECGESTGLHVIGRLDKETSGVVVFARNQLAAAGIGRQKQQKAAGFASGTEKEYLAWVCGSPEDSEGTVNAPIASDPDTLQWMRVCPEGKPAVTHYEVLQCRGGFSLLHLRLETGEHTRSGCIWRISAIRWPVTGTMGVHQTRMAVDSRTPRFMRSGFF